MSPPFYTEIAVIVLKNTPLICSQNDRFVRGNDSTVTAGIGESCYTWGVKVLPSEIRSFRNSLGEQPRSCLNRRAK